MNNPKFYFNITNYMYFENIIFNGANAFAQHYSDSNIKLMYTPTLFCNVSSTPNEKDGLVTFNLNEPTSVLGFKYNCSDHFYSGSKVPKSSNLNYKCTS